MRFPALSLIALFACTVSLFFLSSTFSLPTAQYGHLALISRRDVAPSNSSSGHDTPSLPTPATPEKHFVVPESTGKGNITTASGQVNKTELRDDVPAPPSPTSPGKPTADKTSEGPLQNTTAVAPPALSPTVTLLPNTIAALPNDTAIALPLNSTAIPLPLNKTVPSMTLSPLTNETSPAANKTATALAPPAKEKEEDESSGEVTFPAYGDYQGNVSSSSYHPFLAEVDTLFSSEPMSEYAPAPYETRYRALDDSRGQFDVLKHWGNLSPYFSSPLFPEMQKFKALPANCKLKQVHMLHRHGARLPTEDYREAGPHFGNFISNLTMSNTTFGFDGPLSFLNDWTYDLGSNLLTPAGSQQMYDSGVQSYYRYSALYNSTAQKHKPIVRSTSQSRVIDSATYYNLGFFGKNAPNLVEVEVLIESEGFNSTLSPGESCSNGEDFQVGEPKVQKWLQTYLAPTIQRFQKHVQGFTLTPKLVFGMQALCAYETYAVGVSDFCPLFNKAEWQGFQYALDLHFSWNYGFANPSGRAQGIGWGQELMARLKSANFTGPITSQNATLDEDPKTFPTDQRFYFDFTHDSVMVSVLAALNFSQFDAQLDPVKMDPKRNFITSHLIPFAARLFFEVLDCHEEGEKQHYIRTILNDALLPLGSGQGCPPRSMVDGLCPLDKFVSHFQKTAVAAANYQDACFNTSSTPPTSTVPAPSNTTVPGPSNSTVSAPSNSTLPAPPSNGTVLPVGSTLPPSM